MKANTRPAAKTAARGISVAAIAMFALVRPVLAQITGGDWCQGKEVPKQSAAISITTNGSGEHLLVDAVANQKIQVCAFSFDLGGTSTPTAEFDYGSKTSADCDTGATALTGAMTRAANVLHGPLDYFTAPAAKQLCLKLSGTTPTAVGVITFVQR